VLGYALFASTGMMTIMKITDPRIMKTTQVATIVVCALFIGFLGAKFSPGTLDWALITIMAVILVCDLLVMFIDIWKRSAPRP
jgi:hypothetical protein